jgi:uncharacterized membrane protein YtjA (UPF0391 family)
VRNEHQGRSFRAGFPREFVYETKRAPCAPRADGADPSLEVFSVREELFMLRWALIFLVIALVAGVLGFGYLGATAALIAKILFVVFLVLFIISLINGRRTRVVP